MNKHIVKIILGLLLLLIIIVATASYSHGYLKDTSNEIDSQIVAIETHIKSGQWDIVNSNLSKVQEKWDTTEDVWAILVDHFEIDNIDISLTRMSKFIETKSVNEALAEAGALRKLIQHIPGKSDINMKNIF